jgi:hypothetical protein
MRMASLTRGLTTLTEARRTPTFAGRLGAMPGLWKSTDGKWELASAVGFEDEATLHSLVEEAPHCCPCRDLYNDGGPSLYVHRTVFEKRAPASIPKVEALIAPVRLGQGNTVRVISDDLLTALTDAYREAVNPASTPPVEDTPGSPAAP